MFTGIITDIGIIIGLLVLACLVDLAGALLVLINPLIA
jgi:hypothetical protein